jgi:GNAT superfamily N-acetyltransferase
MTTVRVVGPEDWQLWKELRLEGLLDTPIGFGRTHAEELAKPDAAWQESMSWPGLRVMAFEHDEPVGMAGGFRRENGVPVLFAVYVRPAARGRGVLGLLVDSVLAWAAPDALQLDVHEDNARAHAAYLTLGFVDTGAVRVGEGIDGKDLIEMLHPPR